MQRIHRKGDGTLDAGAAGAAPTPGKQTQVGATYQAATSGPAQEVPHRGEMEQAFGQGFGSVQAYTGRAGEMASLGASAAASGETVAFGATAPSRELVAHELTHVVQDRQAGGGGVQGKELSEPGDASEHEADAVAARVASGQPAGPIIQAPGAGIRRNMDNVPGVSNLRAPPDPNAPQMGYDDASIARNTVDESTPLPFTREGGWNAQEILQKLGQYDRIAGTDSDANRCVQAVALASHILGGPSAVTSYLGGAGADGMLAGQQPQPRVLAASRVLGQVTQRIHAKSATYGDLSWAQEALHDIYYGDGTGTPSGDVNNRIVPGLDMSRMQAMSVWCSTPAEILAQVGSLADGEQLVVTTWTVTFNTAYDQMDEGVARDDMWVNIVSPNGQSRHVRIRRIQVPPKPQPSQVDLNRDSQHGHQMLVYRTGSTSFLYDPEITATGTHASALSRTGAELQEYVHDQPNFGMYGYVQILGKITPAAASPFGGGSSSGAGSSGH